MILFVGYIVQMHFLRINYFGEKMKTIDSLLLPRTGKILKNRTVLAAMTNKQSHEDGILSEDEKKWLIRRAMGEFATVSYTHLTLPTTD